MKIQRIGNYFLAIRRHGVAVLRVANPDQPPSSTRGKRVTRVCEFPVSNWGQLGSVTCAVKAALQLTANDRAKGIHG
jgi:hypothetical protein